MRKLIAGLIFLVMSECGVVHAEFSYVQDRGPVLVATFTSFSLQMIPQIVLSTGTNMVYDSTRKGTMILSTPSAAGDYQSMRMTLDILNYSTHSAWVGYDANVSSWAAPAPRYLGWMIPQVSTMTPNGVSLPTPIPSILHLPGSIIGWWIVSEDTVPLRQFVAVQQK